MSTVISHDVAIVKTQTSIWQTSSAVLHLRVNSQSCSHNTLSLSVPLCERYSASYVIVYLMVKVEA